MLEKYVPLLPLLESKFWIKVSFEIVTACGIVVALNECFKFVQNLIKVYFLIFLNPSKAAI